MLQFWPVVLGADAACVIDSVGESVRNFESGDEVFNLCSMGKQKRHHSRTTPPSMKSEIVGYGTLTTQSVKSAILRRLLLSMLAYAFSYLILILRVGVPEELSSS